LVSNGARFLGTLAPMLWIVNRNFGHGPNYCGTSLEVCAVAEAGVVGMKAPFRAPTISELNSSSEHLATGARPPGKRFARVSRPSSSGRVLCTGLRGTVGNVHYRQRLRKQLHAYVLGR
jgi:hypothetical protein